MSILRKTFVFPGAASRETLAEVFAPLERPEHQRPTLVICHGFKGFKDWGFFPVIAEHFASLGFQVLNFNFSHNGCDISGREEADLEAFKQNRLSYEAEDIALLLDFILKEGVLPYKLKNEFVLLAHSRGGAAAIQAASHPSVKGLILLASVSRPPPIAPELEAAWRKDGVSWVENARTKTRLPLGVPLLEEYLKEQATLERCVSQLNIPICIIHGSGDKTVPASAAKELKSWAPNSELHLLEGAGHTFSITHPYAGDTDDFLKVLALSEAFLSSL